MKKKIYKITALLLATALMVMGCGSAKSGKENSDSTNSSAQTSSDNSDSKKAEAPQIDGLTYESTMDLTYAQEFDVFYYKDGYKLIDVHEGRQYLIVPEGKEAPKGLDSDIVVINQPVQNIYMAATAIMSLFDALDAIDTVKFSGLEASGWYVESAKKAMESGAMTFAGKYSEPDYEMLVDEDCDLAIESTMILHTPKVQEMIESLDIPVMIDRSSYESHPLGRTEWIKLYAAMLNKEDAADAFFEKQVENVDALKDFKNTEKTVAFFYVSSDGTVVVRRSDDYIPKMIELSGGRYVFDDLTGDDSNTSAVKLTMEEFYAQAADADYLIYNSSIDNPINSVKDLEEKDALFSDFKAVKEGNVWCTGKYLYQATDIVGELITDMNLMLTGGDESKMTFLYHVK